MSGTSERVRDILFREKLRESIKVDRRKIRTKKRGEKLVKDKRLYIAMERHSRL